MAKQGIVSIGLQVNYQKTLDAMIKDFKNAVQQASNEIEKIKVTKGVEKSFSVVNEQISGIEAKISELFETFNSEKISTDKFEAYQKEMSGLIASMNGEIKNLDSQLHNLGNAEYISGLNSQFDTLSQSVLGAYKQISSVMDIVKTFSGADPGLVNKYDEALVKIKMYREEAERASRESSRIIGISDDDYKKRFQGDQEQLVKQFEEYANKLDDVSKRIKDKQGDLSGVSKSNPHFKILEGELASLRAEAQSVAETLLLLDTQVDKLGINKALSAEQFDLASSFSVDSETTKKITDFIAVAHEYKNTVQEVNTLQLKNGKLQIPVRLDENVSKVLKSELQRVVDSLKNYANGHPIIAKVKLTLDGDKSKTPGIDISKSIGKAYKEGAREAETIIKDSITTIQKEFESVPIKIKPDAEAFTKDLKGMINKTFQAIAKSTTGLNVNKELEKLIENLKEVSTSLSGNEKFKFGLDEESIQRVTNAINDMADMIQRAFKVASNSDISAQWSTIEDNFKRVAGEEGKLLKGNKEHKAAIKELAAEYKKYLDMGGKNDLSSLTKHKQTVKNITAEYEELNKVARDVAKQQNSQAKKKTGSAEVSSADKEAITAVSSANKKLETQATNTSLALEKEGKTAQDAASKFRKLAKEKGTATVANRELAKSAQETAKALEREARAKKETKNTTSKNAIDGNVYNSNFSQWQTNIEKALRDSGEYAGIYEAKISQATNGTVKFTAVVRTLDGELRKFSSGVNDAGEIFSPSIGKLSEKQAANFEKNLDHAKRVREAMIGLMDGESGEEKSFFNRTELEQGIQALIEAEAELDRFKVKKVSLEEDGKLAIATEVKEANGQVKAFVATFDSVGDIIDEETGAIKEFVDVSTGKLKSLGDILEDKFDKGKFTVKMPKANDTFSLNQKELWQYLSAIEKAAHELENADTKYKVSLGSDGAVNITKEIQKANGEIKTFEAKFKDINKLIDVTTGLAKDLRAALKDGFDSAKVTTKARDVAKEAQEALDSLKKREGTKSGFAYVSEDIEELAQRIKGINTIDDLEKFISDLDNLKSKIKTFGDANDFIEKFTSKYRQNSNWKLIESDVEDLKQKIKSIAGEDGLKKFKEDLIELSLRLNNIGKDNGTGSVLGNKTFRDINEVRNNLNSLLGTIGKINEKSIRIKDVNTLTAEITNLNGEIRRVTVNLGADGFARFVDNGISHLGRLRRSAESVFATIKSLTRIYLSPMDFVRYFRRGFSMVKEIDVAMTELKKVSDASIGELSSYFDDAVQSSKELGSSVKDMLSATADWSRNGYNLPDSKRLGEIAVLYKNVGDGINIEEANSSLVSTLQGFQLEASEAERIIDSFNEVSNNFSISSGGIGEALKRSAAAFNAANTDLNQAIALVTTGNEIVQSPEKVGTMWQTVSARIRGTKSELEELGENIEDVLSSSKLQELVKGYTGVDIMLDKDNYKDIYTIVSEIGEKWKELEDADRAALLEALAGKKQSNTLAAVLNNADRLKEVYETAENSAGSAQREQLKYNESLQYSLDQLKAHGEEFWTTFINKDDVKDFIDLLNDLIKGATKLVDTFGSIPSIAGLFGAISSFRGGGLITTQKDIYGRTRLSAPTLTGNIFSGDFFKKTSALSSADMAALQQYNAGLAELEAGTSNATSANEVFDKTMKNASNTAQQLAKNANGAAVNIDKIPKVSKAASVGIKALSVAMNVGLTIAIMTLISGIQKMAGAFDEMSQQAAEATSEYKRQSATLDEHKEKIIDLKTSLSGENLTYTEARNKRSELLEIQKQLIETYGAEAKSIDLVNGSLDAQIEKIDTVDKQKRQEWENEVNKLSAGQQWQKWIVGSALSLSETALMKIFKFHRFPVILKIWTDYFDNTTNIDRITKKFENFKKSINLSDLKIEKNELEALKLQMDSYEGVSFVGNKMTISGDAKTVSETVTKIQTEVIGTREDLQDLNQDLKDVYNSANKIVSANWDTYNTAVKNKILDDKEGLEYYGKLTEAYESYQNAVESGDETAINEAKKIYSKLLSEINSSKLPDTFKEYFENMYPDISGIINEWKFEINIVPKINSNDSGLKDDIKAVKNLTTEDIIAAFENNGAGVDKEQWSAIVGLNSIAQDNGLNLTTLLEQLREHGYLMSNLDKAYEKFVGKVKGKYGSATNWDVYFKKNSIDTEEEFDNWNKITNGINDAVAAMKAYAEATKQKSRTQINAQYTESQQILAEEYQKAMDFGLESYLPKIKDGTIQSVFGNVDMDKRTIITWSEELKQTYKDALDSWGYDPEIGSVDTVFGNSGRFGESINGVGWEVAFTPILPNGTFLSHDTVSEYIEKILSEAYKDDQQITEDELKSIDAQGRRIGKIFVKGIFAGVDDSQDYENNGNWAETVGRLMHFSGAFGATGIARSAQKEALAQIGTMDALIKEIDDIQSAYQKAKSAIEEYNEQGYLSVDTYQNLLSIEPKYLQYLTDERGNINLSTDAVESYTSALIDSMAMKQIVSIIDYVSGLTDEQRQLYLTKAATDEATNSLIDFAAATLQTKFVAGDLTETELDSLKGILGNVIAWAEAAKAGVMQGGLDKSNKTAKDLAEKEKKFAEDMAEAWKKDHLEQLKDGLEQQKDIIERYKKNLEISDFGFDIVEKDDFSNRADLLVNKLDNLKLYGKAMREEFDRISNIIPQTGDEAQALASRIEELGADMRSNISNIRETTVELQKLSIDMASTLMEDRMGELRSQMNSIDRHIEALMSDYASDYQHLNGMLFTDSLLPSYSKYDRQRREKQRADRELITLEQETQDKINEVVSKALEKQSEENAKAREKERQKLVEDMEKARKDVGIKLGEISEDYSEFLSNNEEATSISIKKIVDEFRNADIKLPEVDISSIDVAVEKVRNGLGTIDKFSTFVNGSMPYYNQADYAGQSYGGSGRDFRETGCAPTAAAMALGALGVNITPIEAGNFSWENGYYVSGQGTNSDLIPAIAKEYGKKTVNLGSGISSKDDVLTALKNGFPVTVDVKGGTFNLSGGGHYLNLSGITPDGKIKVHDPGSREKSAQTWDIDTILNNAIASWAWYATGTPQGNAKAKNLGLAGENYRPEILIDKATGEATYIDKPTVIDVSKTDVVGERATANLPKFANGKDTPLNQLSMLTTEQIEAILSTNFSKSSKLNALGVAEGIYRAQQSTGISALATLAIAAGESGWGTSKVAIDKNNFWGWNHYPSGGKSAYERATTFSSDIGEAFENYANKLISNGYASKSIAQMAMKYCPDGTWENLIAGTLGTILNTVANSGIPLGSSEISVANSTVAFNTPSKSKEERLIDSIEAFYDGAIDDLGRIESKYSTEIRAIENDKSLGNHEKATALYDVLYREGLELSKKGASVYENLSKWFDQWLSDVEAGTAEWSSNVYKAFNDALYNIKDTSFEVQDEAIKKKQAAAEAEWSNSSKWIAERKDKGDWSLFGDSEAQAWERVIKWLEEKYPNEQEKLREAIENLKDSRWEHSSNWIAERNQYNDWALFGDSEVEAWERVVRDSKRDYPDDLNRLREAEKNLFEARKKEFDKANSFSNAYLNSQKTLLQMRFDIVNSIADEQHEINKELEKSKTMYEYLDEDTRKLLFNQEDYNKLSEELLDIQDEADKLQRRYEKDLRNATAETVEKITADYERQYKTLMKSYEISKADLEIAKKKQKLNNILNERNVRMFVNGSWQWVANTEEIANAKAELADAQYSRGKTQTEFEQQKSLDGITKRQENLDVAIKMFENGVISLAEAVGLARDSVRILPKSLREAYNLAGVDTPAYTTGNTSRTFDRVWYESNIDYTDRISEAKTFEEALAANIQRNAKISGDGSPYLPYTEDEVRKIWWKGYVQRLNISQEATKLIPLSSEEISGFLNTDIKTWDVSSLMPSFALDNLISNNIQTQQIDQSQDNSVNIEHMTVYAKTDNADELLSSLRRYTPNHS